MNKKIFLLALIIILIIGCKNHSDPLNGLVFGTDESRWKDRLNSLVKKKKLTTINEGSKYYGCIFDSVYVEIETNTEFSSGKLLDYRLDFASKPEIEFKSNGINFPLALRYKYINNVFQKMIKLYGEPDSIIPIFSNKLFKSFPLKPLTDSLIGGFQALWEKKEFNLCFNVGSLGYIMDSTGKKVADYCLSSSYIYYQHPDYKNEIKAIIDTAIAGYTLGDYIKSEVDDPEIEQIGYDYSIPNRKIAFSQITIDRIENLDNRGVISILTDFVFYDNFDNEIGRFEDIELEFGEYKLVSSRWKERRIPDESSESLTYRITYEVNRILLFSKYFNYNSRASKLQKLEYTYQKGANIKAKLELKAIKLDDSSVLKRPVS